MKGRLFLRDDKWYVEYQIINSVRSLPLHADSERLLILRSDKKPEQMIGDKIEFEIVEEGVHPYTDEVKRYAKLTQCPGLNIEPNENLDKQYSREDMIDFAKWIARDWMSILVENKWMWEYQNEVGSHHEYFGYFTDEQLFKFYLVDKNG
jgi:hypothetical protein